MNAPQDPDRWRAIWTDTRERPQRIGRGWSLLLIILFAFVGWMASGVVGAVIAGRL